MYFYSVSRAKYGIRGVEKGYNWKTYQSLILMLISENKRRLYSRGRVAHANSSMIQETARTRYACKKYEGSRTEIKKSSVSNWDWNHRQILRAWHQLLRLHLRGGKFLYAGQIDISSFALRTPSSCTNELRPTKCWLSALANFVCLSAASRSDRRILVYLLCAGMIALSCVRGRCSTTTFSYIQEKGRRKQK